MVEYKTFEPVVKWKEQWGLVGWESCFGEDSGLPLTYFHSVPRSSISGPCTERLPTLISIDTKPRAVYVRLPQLLAPHAKSRKITEGEPQRAGQSRAARRFLPLAQSWTVRSCRRGQRSARCRVWCRRADPVDLRATRPPLRSFQCGSQ